MAGLALVLIGLALALAVLLWQIERHRPLIIQCSKRGCDAELMVHPHRVGYLLHDDVDDTHVYIPKGEQPRA